MNVFSSLQVIQMVAPRDSSRKPQPTSPKLFYEFTGKVVKVSRTVKITKMLFTKWLRRRNRCLPVL